MITSVLLLSRSESQRRTEVSSILKYKFPGAVFLFCPLTFLLLSSQVQAKTLTVGEGRAFTSISSAIRSAAEGDLIEVHPGTYKEHPVIEKSIILKGIGHPVIDGEGKGNTLTINAPSALVEGFRVVGSGHDLAKNESCIYVEDSAKGAAVKDNRVEDCAFGIWLNGTPDVKVTGNHVVGRRELISQKRGNGIHVWNVVNGLIEGNTVEGARDGILVTITRNSLIKDNRIFDLRYGVHYMYADYNRVEGNITYDNRAGLAIMFSKELEIVSNYSYDNVEYGILFRDLMESRVEDNVLVRNEKGLFLYNSLFNELRGNLVADNEIGSHVWAGSEDNRVRENSFIRNRSQIKYIGMADEDWGENGGNYWSNYLGWDRDGNGVGDVPYEANSTMERLVWTYPIVKLLMNSPAVQTLRMVEKQFPVMRSAGIVDSGPLMRPANEEWRKWVGKAGNTD